MVTSSERVRRTDVGCSFIGYALVGYAFYGWLVYPLGKQQVVYFCEIGFVVAHRSFLLGGKDNEKVNSVEERLQKTGSMSKLRHTS